MSHALFTTRSVFSTFFLKSFRLCLSLTGVRMSARINFIRLFYGSFRSHRVRNMWRSTSSCYSGYKTGLRIPLRATAPARGRTASGKNTGWPGENSLQWHGNVHRVGPGTLQ